MRIDASYSTALRLSGAALGALLLTLSAATAQAGPPKPGKCTITDVAPNTTDHACWLTTAALAGAIALRRRAER